MSTRIFVLCLISSIISTVAPLKCQTCFATRDECRNADMDLIECEVDEGYCITLSFRSTMITPSLSLTYKGCARTEVCFRDYYSTTSLDGKYLQMSVACCESDGCNTAPLPLPIRDVLRPNGLLCPAYYQQNGVTMEGYGPILCLGNENRCINVNFTLTALSTFKSTVVLRGCSTKSVCSFPTEETAEAHGLLHYNLVTLKCQKALKLDRWKGLTMKDM